MKFRFVFLRTLHFLVVIFVIVSPFIVSWKIIATFALLNYVVFGLYYKKCPLTEWQFGKER